MGLEYLPIVIAAVFSAAVFYVVYRSRPAYVDDIYLEVFSGAVAFALAGILTWGILFMTVEHLAIAIVVALFGGLFIVGGVWLKNRANREKMDPWIGLLIFAFFTIVSLGSLALFS